MHQIAEQCAYDLTDIERHPILQAEALREKDKEIARLRSKLNSLGMAPWTDQSSFRKESRKKRKPSAPAKVPRKTYHAHLNAPLLGYEGESAAFNRCPTFKAINEVSSEFTSLRFPDAFQGRQCPGSTQD